MDYLTKQFPGAVSWELYRKQGLALLEEGRLERAQEALDTALALVSSNQQRINLLDEYIAILVSRGQWAEVLININEALRLAPNTPRWLTLRQEACNHIGQREDLFVPGSSQNNKTINPVPGLVNRLHSFDRSDSIYMAPSNNDTKISKSHLFLRSLLVFRQQNFSLESIKLILNVQNLFMSSIILIIADIIVLPLTFNSWLHIWITVWVLAAFTLTLFMSGLFTTKIFLTILSAIIISLLWGLVIYNTAADQTSAFVFCTIFFLISLTWHIYLFYPRKITTNRKVGIKK